MNTCSVETTLARQEAVELRNDVHNFVIQHHHRWDNRLKFPPSEIGERYRRGDLGVTLQFSSEGLFKNGVLYSALVICPIFANDKVSDILGKRKTGSAETHNEFMVLVDDVHIVDQSQESISRVGGVIRLKFIDKFYRPCIGDSLYFSFKS